MLNFKFNYNKHSSLFSNKPSKASEHLTSKLKKYFPRKAPVASKLSPKGVEQKSFFSTQVVRFDGLLDQKRSAVI